MHSMHHLRLNDLSRQIKDLENRVASDPSDSNLHIKCLLLQSECDCISIRDREQLIFKLKQTDYEHRDKAGRPTNYVRKHLRPLSLKSVLHRIKLPPTHN